MLDTNWKTLVLIAAIAVGVMFEVIKRVPSDRAVTSAWDIDNLRTNNASQPYSVRGMLENKRVRPQPAARPARVAGRAAVSREELEAFVRANAPTTTEFAHTEKGAEGKPAAGAAAKAKADDEWEIVVDPKTGKKIKRKKKKKDAKKEEPKKEEVAKQEAPKEEPKVETTSEDIESIVDQAMMTGFQPPQQNNRDDDAFNSQEDWQRRLLARPDAEETKRFIDHYLRNLVTADVFYRVVQMMLADPRTEMKLLGVMAAGLTPSVMSFQVLAGVIQKERSGSPTRTRTEGYMNRYSELAQLSVLEKILRSGTGYSVILAAQSLDNSARQYLAPKANRPPKNPTQTQTQHSNAGYFNRFVKLLQGLSSSQKDPQIEDQVKRTLTNLQALLQPPTSPTTTPPNGPVGPGGPQPGPDQTTASTQPL